MYTDVEGRFCWGEALRWVCRHGEQLCGCGCGCGGDGRGECGEVEEEGEGRLFRGGMRRVVPACNNNNNDDDDNIAAATAVSTDTLERVGGAETELLPLRVGTAYRYGSTSGGDV